MKNRKPYFTFNKQEQRGIFFLLLIIVILQSVYYYVKAKPFQGPSKITVDAAAQSKWDSLAQSSTKDTVKLFPFNPNYITDYKGYVLGMSPTELDRLFAYRKQKKFINSAAEFQRVTQVSDSLLAGIAPYFTFPRWTQNRQTVQRNTAQPTAKPRKVKDLNTATAEELKAISGIGDVLSQRIVKFRTRLGGFLVNEQLYDVYGLAPEVVGRALKRFQVQKPPSVEKIDINTATVKELSSIVYIHYTLAQQLIANRNTSGPYTSWSELEQVETFPVEKIERIKLYLTF